MLLYIISIHILYYILTEGLYYLLNFFPEPPVNWLHLCCQNRTGALTKQDNGGDISVV